MAKLKIWFKDQDGVFEAPGAEIDVDEIEETEFGEVVKRFIGFGEEITIELDSKTGTARVIPVTDW